MDGENKAYESGDIVLFSHIGYFFTRDTTEEKNLCIMDTLQFSFLDWLVFSGIFDEALSSRIIMKSDVTSTFFLFPLILCLHGMEKVSRILQKKVA